MTTVEERPTTAGPRLAKLELELTGKCQLRCGYCLSRSSPLSPHGSMTLADWLSVLDQAHALDVAAVQLIGGEPTVSPQDAWRSTMRLVPRRDHIDPCGPDSDGSDCAPASTDACAPAYGFASTPGGK